MSRIVWDLITGVPLGFVLLRTSYRFLRDGFRGDKKQPAERFPVLFKQS